MAVETAVEDPNENTSLREEEEVETPNSSTTKKVVRIVIVLVIITTLVLAIVYNEFTKDTITDYLNWIEENPILGGLTFMLVYMCATVFLIPGSLLTIGSGVIYSQVYGTFGGVLFATVVVFIGASIGCTLAFLLGRYIFQEVVEGWIQKYDNFRALEDVFEERGLRVTFLLRLSPLIPFNVLNYALGLTKVKLRDYALANFGLIPGTFAFCFLGSTLGSLTDAASSGISAGGPGLLIFAIVGTLAALGAAIYVGILSKRELKKLAEENKQKKATGDSQVEMPAQDPVDAKVGDEI